MPYLSSFECGRCIHTIIYKVLYQSLFFMQYDTVLHLLMLSFSIFDAPHLDSINDLLETYLILVYLVYLVYLVQLHKAWHSSVSFKLSFNHNLLAALGLVRRQSIKKPICRFLSFPKPDLKLLTDSESTSSCVRLFQRFNTR